MKTKTVSTQDPGDFAKIVEDHLQRVQLASDRLEIGFAEFQELFSLVLQSSFVDQGVKELLHESFHRFEHRVKKNLNDNEYSTTNLKNWFSFYWSIPISEMEDWSGDELRTSDHQSQPVAGSEDSFQ